MKTEALLLLALIIGIISEVIVILWLDFFISEEKKAKGSFFNNIIKIGLFKEKSQPVIIMVIMIVLSIIGLVWSVITLLNVNKLMGMISILIIVKAFCIQIKFKKY